MEQSSLFHASVREPGSSGHQPRILWGVLWVVGLLASDLLAPRLRAQDIADVLPELKTLPAPASIAPGRRLNYYSTAASVPPSFFTSWPDENGFETPSPAGHGYTQVDVVGLTPDTAALSVVAWQYYLFTGPLVPIDGGRSSLVCHAGGGDWWVHPTVLAKVADASEPGLTILRMPQQVAGHPYQTLRIQRETATTRRALAYDLATGYLVYQSTAVQNGPDTMLTQTYFTGTRLLLAPWADLALPGWVGPGRQLDYDGSYTVVTLGSNPFTLPLTAEVEFTRRLNDWCVYDQTTTLASIDGMPPTVETLTLVTGNHHFSGLCLPPAALSTLTVGQILDTDDVTGAKVEVRARGTLANGHPSVVCRVALGDFAWSDTTFDVVTGVAVKLETFDGKSDLYRTFSELTLVTELPVQPEAPRLQVNLDPGTGAVRIHSETPGATTWTLRRSVDGGRTWNTVPGYQDRPCAGAGLEFSEMPGPGAVLYSVIVQ